MAQAATDARSDVARGSGCLTFDEVLKRSGWTRATTYRRLKKVDSQDGELSRNGLRAQLYSLESLKQHYTEVPWEPQKVVELPQDTGSFTDQLGRLNEKQRGQAMFRYRVIAPLLQAGVGDGTGSHVDAAKGRTSLVKKVAAEHGLAWRTVYGWVDRFRGDALGKYTGLSGIVALADKARADKGTNKINEAGRLYIKRLALDGGFGTTRELHRRYEKHRLWCVKNAGFRVFDVTAQKDVERWLDDEKRLSHDSIPNKISRGTFRKLYDEIPRGQVDLARGEIDKHKNTQVPFIYRAYTMDPLEFVVMDHRQADVMCAVWDRKGARLIRPWMTCAMDMRTRRWLSWVLVETPDSRSITTSVRLLLERFGRPKCFYWDNGGDFESKWVGGLLVGLGSEVKHALPGLARSKPIEPNFRRVSIWERNLPTWTGHKTEVRPEKLERKEAEFKRWQKTGKGDCPFPALEELRETYGVIFDEINARPLRGTGMGYMAPEGKRWMSPLVAWERLAGQVAFERVPMSALHTLMLEYRERKVRHGQIRMTYGGFEAIYVPSADYPPNVLADLNGKTVSVALDTLDLGKVVIYHRDELVCVCQNLELRGMGEAAFKEGMKLQRRILKVQREEQKLVAAQGALDPVANAQRALDMAGEFSEPERPETVLIYAKHEKAAAALGGRGISLDDVPEGPRWEIQRPEQGDEFDPFTDLKNGGGEE